MLSPAMGAGRARGGAARSKRGRAHGWTCLGRGWAEPPELHLTEMCPRGLCAQGAARVLCCRGKPEAVWCLPSGYS